MGKRANLTSPHTFRRACPFYWNVAISCAFFPSEALGCFAHTHTHTYARPPLRLLAYLRFINTRANARVVATLRSLVTLHNVRSTQVRARKAPLITEQIDSLRRVWLGAWECLEWEGLGFFLVEKEVRFFGFEGCWNRRGWVRFLIWKVLKWERLGFRIWELFELGFIWKFFRFFYSKILRIGAIENFSVWRVEVYFIWKLFE